MAIHFDALPGILTSPTKTFEKLKKDANIVDGLKLYIIFAVLAVIISIVITAIFVPSLRIPGMSQSEINRTYGIPASILSSIFNLVLNLLIFLGICWLTTKFVGTISGKKADFSKTTGMLSYTGAAFYAFIGLPLGVISSIVVWMNMSNVVSASTGMNGAMNMSFFGPIILVGIVALLIAIWELLTAGRAVAVCNGATWGTGIVTIFLAVIVIMLIAFVAFLAIGLSMLATGGAFSTTGFALGGL